MAEPVLNQLLEEGATRATELAQLADETAHTLDTLAERAKSLSDKVAAESDEAHGHLQGLVADVEAAAGRLASASQAAADGLGTLAARAEAVEGKVGELLASVKKGADDLEAISSQLTAELDQKQEAAHADYEQLLRRVEELQRASQEHLDKARTALDGFRDAVDAARDEFEDEKTRLLDELHEVEEFAVALTNSYIEAVDQALDATADLRLEVGNRMIAEHNDAVTAVREAFAEEHTQRIGESLEPLRAALQAVASLLDQEEEAFSTRAGEVLAKVSEAVELSDRVRPMLEMASRLG